MSVEISLDEAQPARPRAAPLADDLLRGAAAIAEFVYGDPEAQPARPRAAPLADDLLRGAAEIAEFVFGDPAERRRVYHLATEVKEECRLPVFRLGNILCARRSTLLRWVARQESYSSTRKHGRG